MSKIALTHEQHARRLNKCTNDQERSALLGPSPGGAASDLGISRAAVYSAVNKGNLDAITILDRDGTPTGLIITDASIREYLDRRRRREAKAKAS